MSDMIDMYRDLKDHRREMRAALGVGCPMCRVKQPKRTPTILLPQQRCKVDGYRDARPETVIDEWLASPAPGTGRRAMRSSLWLAAAAASLFDFHPPGNPRFAEMPWRLHEPMPWRGRPKKRNPKRAAQAAAKRARKITKRKRA